MSESDDSQLLITFDAITTRIVGELYEDTQYLKLSMHLPQSDGYHIDKYDTEGCKGLAGVNG
jgi:hypothetical protein